MRAMPEPTPDGELRELVRKATEADTPSIDALLTRYLPRLRAFVRLRMDAKLRNRESSSDLVQSVCREVLQHAGNFRYEGEERFRAWLFQAALHKIIERQRALAAQKRDIRREANLPDADFADLGAALRSPSQLAIAGELADRIERAFDELSDEYREVITLARIVGLPHAEIARQLDRSEGAVRMLLSRALVALIAALDRAGNPR